MRPYLTRPAAPVNGVPSPSPDTGLDRLLADPAIGSTAKAVALVLVRVWAWSKAVCWPSDASIAAKVGRSPGHVQRSLRQLERAGWIEREHTAEVPNGRRIWLNWRRPSAGAQPVRAPALSPPPAPARSEEIVIVNRSIEPEDSPDQRPRQTLVAAQPEPVPEPCQDGASPGPANSPPEPSPPPRSPSPASPRSVRRLGLSLEELAAATAATADPILARELARLTAPAPPPEPAPSSLATPELIARLPGRHDLIALAVRKLCVDTNDYRPATWSFFKKAVEAVASRAVPAEVLKDCYRQATSDLARHPGKILVASWMRAVGRRC